MKYILVVLLVLLPCICLSEQITHSDKIHFIDSIRLELIHLDNNVPVSLLLAQAIIESDWGRSNKVKKYNNLFGLEEMVDGKWSAIRFSRTPESIKYYIWLLNNGKHFKPYRDIRSITCDSYILTYGLYKYSILGDEYIKRVQKIIEVENLKDYD